MGGPYTPQNVAELLDKTVEQKGYMAGEDVKKWTPYFESWIQEKIDEAKSKAPYLSTEAYDFLYNNDKGVLEELEAHMEEWMDK